MAKKFAGCTMEQVDRDLRWVVKYTGWRDAGTLPELKARGFDWNDEEIRDFDLAAKQTDPAMERFVEEWHALEKKHGFITLVELFDTYAE